MSSKVTITSPFGCSLKTLLDTIEKDDVAFTQGRRNNDLVNWFIVKRMLDLDAEDDRPLNDLVRAYQRDFRTTMEDLSNMQRQHLVHWAESWEWKLQVLCEHYWRYTPAQLANLWLPMDYTVQTVDCEGQLTLT